MRPATHTFEVRFLWLALLAILCASACSTINPYEKNRDLLASAGKNLGAENSAAAAADGERLFAGRAAEADKFRLQRYYALYLIAEAHAQAATHQPFLGAGSGESSKSTVGSTRNTDVAHMVAATYYAGLAKDMKDAASKEKLIVEETKLLPPDLESTSVDDAQQKLDLIRLVALSRLGFATTYQNELENWPALHKAESCDEVIGRVHLEKELVPWVYYTLFRYLKDSSDRMAYTFGAKARVVAADVQGAIPSERLDEIVAWVREKAEKGRLDFCCQLCRKPFLYDKLRCMDDNTPITTFFPMARTQ